MPHAAEGRASGLHGNRGMIGRSTNWTRKPPALMPLETPRILQARPMPFYQETGGILWVKELQHWQLWVPPPSPAGGKKIMLWNSLVIQLRFYSKTSRELFTASLLNKHRQLRPPNILWKPLTCEQGLNRKVVFTDWEREMVVRQWRERAILFFFSQNKLLTSRNRWEDNMLKNRMLLEESHIQSRKSSWGFSVSAN